MGMKLDTAAMWKPAPPTERELACVDLVEAADFEIYARKLDLICAEARQIFVRMGAAQMLQSGDVALGIYTAQGYVARLQHLRRAHPHEDLPRFRADQVELL